MPKSDLIFLKQVDCCFSHVLRGLSLLTLGIISLLKIHGCEKQMEVSRDSSLFSWLINDNFLEYMQKTECEVDLLCAMFLRFLSIRNNFCGLVQPGSLLCRVTIGAVITLNTSCTRITDGNGVVRL